MYGTTEKKITHIIDESREKGWGGFVNTVCGKWIRPDRLHGAGATVQGVGAKGGRP